MGQRRKTTKEKELAGTIRKDRLHKEEYLAPVIESGAPQPPQPLAGFPLDVWNHVTNHLIGLDLLSSQDFLSLFRYAKLWGEWKVADDNIQEHGLILINPDSGNTKPSPYYAIRRNASDMLLKIEKEFGFTLGSRAGMDLGKLPDRDKKKKKKKDEFDLS